VFSLLGLRGCPGTNALAYFFSSNNDKERFITLALSGHPCARSRLVAAPIKIQKLLTISPFNLW
jgi:hypothetical protein